MINTTEKYLFNNGLFCDTICVMKNKISFLAILAVALGMNYASASECIDDDCELNPAIVVEEYEEGVVLIATDYKKRVDKWEYRLGLEEIGMVFSNNL